MKIKIIGEPKEIAPCISGTRAAKSRGVSHW